MDPFEALHFWNIATADVMRLQRAEVVDLGALIDALAAEREAAAVYFESLKVPVAHAD